MCSSKVFFFVKIVNEPEILRYIFPIDIEFILGCLFILKDSSVNDHSGKFHRYILKVCSEKFFWDIIVLMLKLEHSVKKSRYTVEKLPDHLLSFLLNDMVALNHSSLVLFEESVVSCVVSKMHAANPSTHLGHVEWQVFWRFVF